MLRTTAALLLVLWAGAAFALDPGQAEGTMTTDKTTTTLTYAYAMRNVHSEYSGKNDALKIILTDKPLPEGTNLRDLDYNFPEGIAGLVICADRELQPQHLVVQHPAGVYDGGWIDLNRDFTMKAKQNKGLVEGHVRCKGVEKASVTFEFDVEFAAATR